MWLLTEAPMDTEATITKEETLDAERMAVARGIVHHERQMAAQLDMLPRPQSEREEEGFRLGARRIREQFWHQTDYLYGRLLRLVQMRAGADFLEIVDMHPAEIMAAREKWLRLAREEKAA
jgi:hypothetical protein